MPVKVYGYARYDCGCVVSLGMGGNRQGFKEQCDTSHELMTAMIRDKRPSTFQKSEEWANIWNAHLHTEVNRHVLS